MSLGIILLCPKYLPINCYFQTYMLYSKTLTCTYIDMLVYENTVENIIIYTL